MSSYHETDRAVNCSLDPTHTPETICATCGVIDTPHVERGQFGPHAAKAICRHCGAFLRWVSAKSAEQRQASRQRAIDAWMASQSPSAAQLAYLRALGHADAPTNKLEASRLISELLEREVANG
jgi:hypothetical protein